MIDIDGKALGMVAGGKKKAASSFYLPLHKPSIALSRLQEGQKILRGTLQTVFRHCPNDEVHRLGLQSSTEETVRSSLTNETGMLVVDQVIPNGPAHNLLEPGDILVKVNGDLATTFLALELLMDENIGKELNFDIERGGTPMSMSLKVQDLDSITPGILLEIGGGILVKQTFTNSFSHCFESIHYHTNKPKIIDSL